MRFKHFVFIAMVGCLIFMEPQNCWPKRAAIYTSGKVGSFGTYSYTGSLSFSIPSPGEHLIGIVTVEGTYNGEYPWILRVYTDNLNYTGIAGRISTSSSAGLVSTDGRFVIPIRVHCPNFGPKEWGHVPDINQPGYRPYIPPSPTGRWNYTDRIIMGIDPRNADWVAGPNRVLFDADDNILGDITLATPFEIIFKADFSHSAVKANYTANLYIELVSAP